MQRCSAVLGPTVDHRSSVQQKHHDLCSTVAGSQMQWREARIIGSIKIVGMLFQNSNHFLDFARSGNPVNVSVGAMVIAMKTPASGQDNDSEQERYPDDGFQLLSHGVHGLLCRRIAQPSDEFAEFGVVCVSATPLQSCGGLPETSLKTGIRLGYRCSFRCRLAGREVSVQ